MAKKPSSHPDEREDKALIRKMVKPSDLKKADAKREPEKKGRSK